MRSVQHLHTPVLHDSTPEPQHVDTRVGTRRVSNRGSEKQYAATNDASSGGGVHLAIILHDTRQLLQRHVHQGEQVLLLLPRRRHDGGDASSAHHAWDPFRTTHT